MNPTLSFLIIAALTCSTGCSKVSMHQIFEFGKERDVYLQLDLDLSIPGFSEQIADSPGEEYAMGAYLIRQGQDELLVNMHFKGGSSSSSLPVIISGLQQSVNTILEVPLTESVDPTLGTYVFRFTLSPASAASGLRLDDGSQPLSFSTIETNIQRGDNLAAINYRSTIVAKIVDASGVSTVTETLTADKLAATIQGIGTKVQEKIASLSAPVVTETVNSRFSAGKITDVLTPVLRYLEYSVATDTTLQDSITPVITEKSGIGTSEVVSRYTSRFITTAVSDMSQMVNNTNYSSMKEVITVQYISQTSIPSSTDTLSTTWTPKNLTFTDSNKTTIIAGSIAVSHPSSTNGLYGFSVYIGSASTPRARYVGFATLSTTGATTTLTLPTTTLANGETHFIAYPVVDIADTSTQHGKQEINSPYLKLIDNLIVLCTAGRYLSAGSCVPVGGGYWTDGTNDTRTACTNAPSYASYSSVNNTSASCAWACNAGFNLSSNSCVCPSGRIVVNGVCNAYPIALSAQSGVGYAYQSSQLGGLTFTRYGEDNPSGNQVDHEELMDFLDDPVGNADGVRGDGTVTNRPYAGGGSPAGWTQSADMDKYVDSSGYITPVSGGDSFGDTYRGYFVPPTNGIYRFVNMVVPDNSVRFMMSPNECPNAAIAVVSTDIIGEQTINGVFGTWGAVDTTSVWIVGNGGTYQDSGAGAPAGNNNEYLHNTSSFFPSGTSNADYVDGDVYLLAGKIYYLEIRYGEGGGGNAFSFGYDRKNFASSSWDGVGFLNGMDLLPFGGSDKYVPRQSCAGSYDATAYFTDPDADTLTYSARLVTSNGTAISGAGSNVSSIGLSFNSVTGQLSGSLNSSYSGQKVIFSARDANGTNTDVDSTTITFVANPTCSAGKYYTGTGYCSRVGLGYWSDGSNNQRSTCTNTPPANATFNDYSATSSTCSWACDTGYTLSSGQCI